MKSAKELEAERLELEAKNLREASDEAERQELAQSSSQISQLVNQKQSQKESQSHTPGQPMYLGTNHLEPLQKKLQEMIPVLDQFLLDSNLEMNHLPHLRSLVRNANSLNHLTIRVVRLVGRLYGSQGWDLKYSHAANTEYGRRLQARGGYNAIQAAMRREKER